MNPVTPSLNRRGFLRGGAAAISLPFLESLGFSSFSSAAALNPVAAPKRMIFLGMGFGVTADEWYPDRSEVGHEYTMPSVLSPLNSHKKDITIIQNLQHQHSQDGHSGSTFWLTGANRYAVPGRSFHNTVSVDQVAAEQFGEHTRFTSIQLASRGNAGASGDGHGPGLSLAWNRHGKPVAGLNTPVAAFHRLFSDSSTPLAQLQHELAEKRSVLDAVMSNAKSIGRKLSKGDTEKLDEYLQSVREIEIRISKEEQWLNIPKKKPVPAVGEPNESLEGMEEMRMMYDLMFAAMQVDASRVFTYRMPVNSLISSLGAKITAHSMSHYSAGERRLVSQSRDRANAQLLAEFLTKLKGFREPDGTSLYESSAIAMGTNLSSVHNLTNCPTLVTGGGAGIKHGRHIVMDDKKTPLCNLWLSLLNGSGVNVSSHGDSTGRIEALFEA